MCAISIDYIDGFLRCLADGCMDADYVALYGASAFPNESATLEQSLNTYFSIDAGTKTACLKNYQQYKDQSWVPHYQYLLKTWVDDRHFYRCLTHRDLGFFELYKDDLTEQIELCAGQSMQVFSADVDWRVRKMSCPIIGFVGSQASFFLYFGCSD